MTDAERTMKEPSVDQAAKIMDDSIQRELSAMEATLRSEMERCERLRVGAPFVNGLAAAAQTWRRDLENVADKVRAESESVTAALTGKTKPEVTVHVNYELAAAVASDPDRKKR